MTTTAPQTHRGYTEGSVATDPPGTPIPFIASTPGVKRDGLDLRASGWRLDTYVRNPVFQWAHSRTEPSIGRVEATVASKLRSLVYFDQEDPFARKIESKYRRGFLNAVSVSWDWTDSSGQRIDAYRMRPEELRDQAFYDMTELSGVPIPADPDALIQRQRSALSVLGHELVTLFDDQEHEHGEYIADQLRTAVLAELEALGVELPTQTPAPAAPVIDRRAASALLGAFDFLKGTPQ